MKGLTFCFTLTAALLAAAFSPVQTQAETGNSVEKQLEECLLWLEHDLPQSGR